MTQLSRSIYKSMWGHIYLFILGNRAEVVAYIVNMFYLTNNSQTISQHSHTVLYSHKLWMRIPVAFRYYQRLLLDSLLNLCQFSEYTYFYTTFLATFRREWVRLEKKNGWMELGLLLWKPFSSQCVCQANWLLEAHLVCFMILCQQKASLLPAFNF